MPERIVEFVFRVKTNAEDDSIPDDLIQHGSEMLFPNFKDEGADVWTEYIPEGSHWRDVPDDDEELKRYRTRKQREEWDAQDRAVVEQYLPPKDTPNV